MEFCIFRIFHKSCKIDEMGHAGGVRRHVASICGRSFEPRSIFGKVDVGSISYLDIEKKVLIQNQTFKIGLGQAAPPKTTAMTIG